MDNLRIVGLKAENFKRLVAVEITPTGPVVKISGKNKQGKSSILDAMWAALAGMDSIPGQPIRKGEEKAIIRLDLGEMVVTRTFSKAKPKDGELLAEHEFTTSIKVENKDGFKAGSPQTMLSKLFSQRAADPLRFARLDAKGQFEVARKFVPDVDFEVIAAANKQDFERRRDINRDADREAASAATITVPEETPDEPVDEQALVDEIAAAGEVLAAIEAERQARIRRQDRLAQLTADIGRLREQATNARADADRRIKEIEAEYEQKLENINRDITGTEAGLAGLQEEITAAAEVPAQNPPDTTAIRARLATAKATNANVALKKQKAEHQRRAGELSAESKALTERMEGREKEKQDKIAAAKMPVDGLAFGDGILLYNGLPFDQASYRERILVSCALEMATNPGLRVLRIEHGNDLDSEGLALIAEMAAANNFQVWVETVDETGKVGIVIEDGKVAAVNE